MSSAVNLSLDTIGDLDGGIARGIIDAAIRAAVLDTEDRGGDDEKPRKVVITLTMEKIDGGSGIKATVDAQCKVPAYKTRATVGQITLRSGKPVVQFQPLAPDNPRQETFGN